VLRLFYTQTSVYFEGYLCKL